MDTTPARIMLLFLLLLVLVAMEACTIHAPPRYQALSQSSIWDGHSDKRGYFDYQIDERTYLIGYSNYLTTAAHIYEGDFLSWKWVKGAQEYALYRASELTMGKGQKSFVILFKDDWSHMTYTSYGYRGGVHPIPSPGAVLIIRILDTDAVPISDNDNRVYQAEMLLENLPRANIGLAEYQGMAGSAEYKSQHAPRGFQRWRSSISPYDSVPLPAINGKGIHAGHEYDIFQPGAKVTKLATDRFDIAIWDEVHVSPLQILLQCVVLADREGYKAFKLANWTIEEHYGSPSNHSSRPYWGRLWFRNTVDVVLLQEKESTNFEPVFVVDEIRSRLDTNGAPLAR